MNMKKSLTGIGCIVGLTVFLAGCTPKPSLQPTAYDQINSSLNNALISNKKFGKGKRLPASVSAALMPSMNVNLPRARAAAGRKFNLSVHDVPAKDFFMGLVKSTNVNMIVSPNVKGNISLTLKNVNIPETLNVIQDVYGYEYKKTNFGYEVFPNKIQTRMFTVNYLDVDRSGKSVTTLSTGQVSQKIQGSTGGSSGFGSINRSTSTDTKRSGGEVETDTKMDFWKQLTETLQTIVGKKDGEKVVVNPEAGLIIVKAYPIQLREVAKYLDDTQNTMDRQVILEAKILEVTLNHDYQAGINWKILGAQLNALDAPSASPFIESLTNTAFQISASSGSEFNMILRMLGTQGNVQVLSSPRVSTLNNQKAVIKVGTDEFFVTGVSSSTTENIGGSTTPTQDVQLTPFFSGITLDVTPQIGSRGWVILHIHPSISKVVDQTKELTVAGEDTTLPLALSTIRETDTMVRAKNGQVVVLGGLMENQTSEDVSQLPFFGNIPFLGTLFRNTHQTSKKSELVILLRPIVIKGNAWNNDLLNTRQAFKRDHVGFHFGNRPDMFGTMGEKHVPYGHYYEPQVYHAPKSTYQHHWHDTKKPEKTTQKKPKPSSFHKEFVK